jgi:hypothetical protein
MWRTAQGADAAIAQMAITGTRFDGGAIGPLCCNVFRMRGKQVCECLVYVDITAVFAPASVS